MKNFNYVTDNEIAVHGQADALELVSVLTDNGYVVMVSREEELYIVNYVWTSSSNRNDVVFNSREEFEDFLFNVDNTEDE